MAQLLSISIIRKEIKNFVSETCYATRLQTNKWYTLNNERMQCFEDISQKTFCHIEHAKVIERATAAEDLSRYHNLVTNSLKHLNCSLSNFGMEVVVESVRPEKHLGLPFIMMITLKEPLLKCAIGKYWDLTLRCYAYHCFYHIPQQWRLNEEV